MSFQSHDGSKVAIFCLLTFPHVCSATLTTAENDEERGPIDLQIVQYF